MKIKKKTLTLTHPGEDLAAMRVYFKEETGEEITYDDPFVEFAGSETPLELTLPDDVPVSDGTWRLGFTALDESGNESDIVDTGAIPFDFVPPASISGWSIS